jgi:hypothetical protein
MLRYILILFTVIITFCSKAISQETAPVGMEVGFGKGINIYGSSTNKYFSNAFPPTPKLYFYFYDVFFGFDLNDYNSTCKKDIVLENKTYSTDDKMTLNFGSFLFGYKFYFKEDLSIDPYFGFITSSFQSLNDKKVVYTKSGNCGGFVINKYFILRKKTIRPLIFFNSRLNYNKLRQMNPDLGNYNLTFDIGLGIEFGPKWNKKFKR